VKTEIWNELNKDYLELMASKEKNATEKPPPKKRRKNEKKTEFVPAETAAEATITMLKKRVSKKLNYSAIEGIFNVDQNLFDPKISKLEKVLPLQQSKIITTEGEDEQPIIDYTSDGDDVYD